jgi:hypothetical protein
MDKKGIVEQSQIAIMWIEGFQDNNFIIAF